jgi:hypothetical protein
MAASNGGYTAQLGVALYPVCTQANNVGVFYYYNTANFNDTLSSGFYDYKVEDVICGRTPTARRVFVSYRDLGVATVTLYITATNDLQQVVSTNVTLIIGNTVPTNVIMTKESGIPALTGQNFQVSWMRLPNGGPVSITKVRIEGTVEKTEY